jgi:SAM-dependent methyltransferase
MTVATCPVCDGPRLRPFLQRRAVPVHQNLIVASESAARAIPRGDLDFHVCENCGFVFNRAFDFSLLSYGEHYDGSQCYAPSYNARLDALTKDLVENRGVRNCTIVEVGCGRGRLLHKLVAYPGANNRGFGFDPSYVGPESELDGRLVFRNCFYDETCVDIPADVVMCRHVIEHLPDPMALLRSVRKTLGASSGARVFFETPCAEWMLRARAVWDFFYEHCSLFTAASLSLAFCRAGFAPSRVDHIFGGQYLWLEARVIQTDTLARTCARHETALREQWLASLRKLNLRGRVAVWGAGAKGATFASLVDAGRELIDCLVDVNPNKRGHFVPGTGHAIVSPTDLAARGVGFAILLNANYRDEVRQLLADTGSNIELIDWSKS